MRNSFKVTGAGNWSKTAGDSIQLLEKQQERVLSIDDDSGRDMVAVLFQIAERGVDVRIMVDGINGKLFHRLVDYAILYPLFLCRNRILLCMEIYEELRYNFNAGTYQQIGSYRENH